MFTAHVGRLGFPAARRDVRVVRLIVLVRLAVFWCCQTLCGLRGHVMVRHFEPARLSLQCLVCAAETPGWTIDVRPEFRRREPTRPQARLRVSRSDNVAAARPNRPGLESWRLD